MMQILELMPLIAFFTAYQYSGEIIQLGELSYQLDGIYGATAALMVATTLQLLIVWLWKRKIEKRLWWLVAVVMVFGGATLALHDQRFIQWKPTIFNWVLGVAMIGSHLFTEKNLIERMLGQQLQLPGTISIRLTWLWGGYFFLVGALNLVVVAMFSEAFWVSYKMWSAILFTLAMSIATAALLMPYLKVGTTEGAVSDPTQASPSSSNQDSK